MSEEEKYLHQLSQKLQKKLGSNLIGLYQTGSGSLNNYKKGKSDLDVLGVIMESISKDDRNYLANTLDHKNFPCPAKGLDLIIFTKENITNIQPKPRYEFWFSTGGSWHFEEWAEGNTQEMLIFIELCRRNGKTLFGGKPNKIFNPVRREWLIESLLEMLHWHKAKILDPFHDPLGVNSILNACRVLAFVKNGQLISKSAGGEWFLENKSKNDLVQKALAIRNGKADIKLSKEQISSFLDNIIKEIE